MSFTVLERRTEREQEMEACDGQQVSRQGDELPDLLFQ